MLTDFELLVKAANEHTDWPHITWDADDGWEFDLRLADNTLLMANLYADGRVDASVYDTSSQPTVTLKRMPNATAAEVAKLIEEAVCQ